MNTEKPNDIDANQDDIIVTTSIPLTKQRKRFQFKKLFLTLLILTFFSAFSGTIAFLYLSYTNKFPIKTVTVIGVYQYVKENDIQATLEPYILNKGLFAFSERQAEKALKQVPGVANVTIYRIFPATIKVVVTEYTAQARFTDGTLLSADGTIFHALNPLSNNSNLPLLNADPHYRHEVMEMLESIKPVFTYMHQNVTGLGLSNNGDWSVQLNNQTWIMLGKHQMQKRVLDFLTAYPVLMSTAPAGATLSQVDLRYQNGFSVVWSGGTPPAKSISSSASNS